MIEFRAFGGLELRRRSGPVLEGALAQPKRCALLAYLAIARPRGFHHRETLLPLFWPELDGTRARRALRQSVHFLRRALGSEIVVSRGPDHLGVDERFCWCDVPAFEAAIAAGNHLEAVTLYRGELLPGLFVAGSAEFDQWLESERTRLRLLAAQAAGVLADEAEAAGDAMAAVRWSQRAAALLPHDEPLHRRLLHALQHAGDGAGALEAYHAFARWLADEYELAPSEETRFLAEAIRARPALGRREVTRPPAAAPPLLPGALPGPVSPPVGPRQRRRRTWYAAMLATAAVCTVGFLALREVESDDGSATFAVLPFAATGPDSLFWSEAAVHLLSLNLDGLGGLRRGDMRQVLRTNWEAGARPGIDESLRLAARAGAGYVLTGSVLSNQVTTWITVEVWDARTRRKLGSAVAHGPRDQPAALFDRLTEATVTHTPLLSEATDLPRANLAAVSTQSVEALRAWVAGERHFRRSRFIDAYREYTRAAEADSLFALAHLRRWQAAAFGNLPYTEPWPMTAARHRGRLPARDAAIVDALTRPASNTTFAPLERLVGRYPDDAELLFQLADRYYHERWGGDDRFRGAFARVIQLDPSFTPAYSHLIEDALTSNDRRAAERLLAALHRVDPAAAEEYSLARRLLWSGAARRLALAALDTAGTAVLQRTLRVLERGPDPALRLRVAYALTHSRHPPATRGLGHGTAVDGHFAAGRLSAAAEAFRRAEPRGAGARTVLTHYLFWRRAGVPVDTALVDSAAALVAAGRLTASPRYLLGAHAAARGRPAELAAQLEALERPPPEPEPDLYRQANLLTARAVRAVAAYEAGDFAAAAAALEQVLQAPGVWAMDERIVVLWHVEAARYLLDAGRPEAALSLLELLAPLPATASDAIRALHEHARNAAR
jgi:DNA-binding SARP family transcriptional activator